MKPKDKEDWKEIFDNIISGFIVLVLVVILSPLILLAVIGNLAKQNGIIKKK